MLIFRLIIFELGMFPSHPSHKSFSDDIVSLSSRRQQSSPLSVFFAQRHHANQEIKIEGQEHDPADVHVVKVGVADVREEVNHEKRPAEKFSVDPVGQVLNLILKGEKIAWQFR